LLSIDRQPPIPLLPKIDALVVTRNGMLVNLDTIF